MSDQKNNKEELLKEVQQLRVEYNCLKSLYEKGIYDWEQEERALKVSEEKYRFMFDNSPQPNWIYDIKTLTFLDVNEAAIKYYGYSRQEFLSMTLRDIHPLVCFQTLFKANEFLNISENKARAWRHVKKNGEFIFVETTSHSVCINGIDMCYVVIQDINDGKRVENELVESEKNFRRSISDSPVGIRIVTVDGKTIYANKTLLDIYELNSLEEFTSMSTKDRYTAESYKHHQKRKVKRQNGQDVLEYEVSFRCCNCKIRHVKISRKEVLWNGIKHFQVITLDITKQRNAEDKLRKLSRVVEQSPNAICITDTDGIIEYINPRTTELTGFTKDELIGAHIKLFSSGLKQQEGSAQLWQTIKSGDVWSGELCNKKKNGELYWETATVSPIFDNQGKITHFLSIKEDVTESKKMLQDLILTKEHAEESEIFLRTFIENVPFEIWACDMDNVGILENKMHVDHFGSILGTVIKDSAVVGEKKIQLWEDNIKRVMNGEIIAEECESEINYRRNIFQQIAFPIYKKGKITGIAGLNINVTDQKLAEIALVNSEEQLRKFASHLQNIREEERSALAREIHDDLGQILVALKIDLGLLKQKVIKDGTSVYLEEILVEFENLANLINDTIKTARRIMNGLRPEQLELLGLEVSIKEYLREFENRHHLNCEFISSVPKLEIDQQQTLVFFRIFQEALTNIAKHAKATTVKIEFSNFENKLVMEIVDNGIGFNLKNNGRIDSYGMIGMKERVFLLKGKLNVTSKVGQGTRVRVELPY